MLNIVSIQRTSDPDLDARPRPPRNSLGHKEVGSGSLRRIRDVSVSTNDESLTLTL